MGLTTKVVRGENAERLLLLIHGLGADENDLAALVPHIDPDGRFTVVLPRGQYSAPPGYGWFKFDSPQLMTATLRSSLDAVEETFVESCDLYGLPRQEAVVGGFSQGCVLALALALREGATPPAAVLGMSGFLAEPDGERLAYDFEADPLPAVLLQHGTEDELIPVEAGQATAHGLAERGVPVTWRTYQMPHAVSLDSVRDAKEWLDRVVAGERPSEPPPPMPDVPADARESAAPPTTTPGVEHRPGEPDGTVHTVTAATFDAEVLRSDVPVIVDFWAPWCQPCHQIAPIVERIAAMRKGSYKVVKLNVDEAQEIAQRYEIQSIPLVALFRNGRLERRSTGVKDRPTLEAELGMLVIP